MLDLVRDHGGSYVTLKARLCIPGAGKFQEVSSSPFGNYNLFLFCISWKPRVGSGLNWQFLPISLHILVSFLRVSIPQVQHFVCISGGREQESSLLPLEKIVLDSTPKLLYELLIFILVCSLSHTLSFCFMLHSFKRKGVLRILVWKSGCLWVVIIFPNGYKLQGFYLKGSQALDCEGL